MIRLCFVCLGNICRSPTAEGIMLALVRERGLSTRVLIDSAGTAAAHVGERPDARSLRTARARGLELPSVARKFIEADFARFDYVLAMDRANERDLLQLARSAESRAKVRLLRSFDERAVRDKTLDVPDPYYGGPQGFEEVFDLCARACEGLLAHLTGEHDL